MDSTLPPQIQNLTPKPAYAVIQPALPKTVTVCWQDPKSICRQSPHESEHFGGYTVSESGTARASVASGVTQNMNNGWIPWEGKIPSLLVQFDYEAHQREIIPELGTPNKS